ncbi:MAG: penicillin acylase family protein [Candidatus Hydrogenedens sp.]|jgi:acyl-homoserine lactone acylase PvdQ|nr:penicillin acylase family protein [Candidatus Hydrogenedens sp.]
MKAGHVFFSGFLVALSVLISCSGWSAEVTLYRDSWGVPHIYGERWEDAAYALGKAQAEDRLEDIYKNVRTALGTMAEAFGEKHAEQDFFLRVFKNAELCEEYWEVAPEPIRSICDNFMRGVEDYVAEHPEKKPDFALELHGWHCVAIGRTMLLNWPLGVLRDEVKRRKEAPAFGSNAFAVAPSRSAEGCPILMIDPHLEWEGLAVFHEAHLHTEKENLCGFFIVGSPAPVLGHNAHVAWACTTGGPDTSDVYMVKTNPHGFMQYEYEGEWHVFDTEIITIKIKDKPTQYKPALYSLYGPLLDMPDLEKNIAFCGATPYFDQVGMMEQMYAMATSKNCEEFYQALGMNQFMEQNLLFADREGNIQYVRTGRTPIRPEGDIDWTVPVPGGSEATRWLGIHDIQDLVQIKNPPQGYFQNCNVSPAVMMSDSPMTPDKYKDYIYNVSWDANSPRGIRLLQLLDADPLITKEAAIAYTLDNYDILAVRWQTALSQAVEARGEEVPLARDLEKAVNGILAWEGYFNKDERYTLLYRFWRMKCQDDIDIVAIADEKPLSAEDQTKMLELLAESQKEMKEKYGAYEIPWGDVVQIGRSGKYFPLECADFGRGPDKKNHSETVLDVSSKEMPDSGGKLIGHNGSGTLMIAFLYPDGIESHSLVSWGQSADPQSPHHVDQAEKLYSSRRLKPTWFAKDELLQNLESTTTITVP